MIALGLFDGMSGGQIALTELGFPLTKYYSSEIDKFANQQIMLNFPCTVQLGSVTDVDVSKLEQIDLLLGGSPCQSFSFAGKRKGMATKCDIEILDLDTYLGLKAAGFEFEGQSYLFWEYIRILQDIRKYNPGVKFLLENVKMGKKWETVLTKAIGCEGIHINSALVCAQNRRRIYWTNIEGIQQPPDRGILLRDILEGEVDEKYYLSSRIIENMDRWEERNAAKGNGFGMNYRTPDDPKSACLPTGKDKQSSTYIKLDKQLNPKRDQFKAGCSTAGAHSGGNHSDMDLIATIYDDYNGRMRTDNKTCTLTTNSGSAAPRNGMKVVLREQYRITCNCGFELDGPLDTVCLMCGEIQSGYTNPVCVAMRGRNPENPSDRTTGAPAEQRLEPNTTGKTNCLTTVGKDNLIMGCDYRSDEGFRVRENGKSGTLAARARNDESCGQLAVVSPRIRRLTPKECCRLQTVPDWYLWEVSDTQQYKMLGNGWTIEVIKHILSYWWEGYLL